MHIKHISFQYYKKEKTYQQYSQENDIKEQWLNL